VSTPQPARSAQREGLGQGGGATTLSDDYRPRPAAPVLLVVDGDDTIRTSLVAALTRRYGADYQIVAAATGASATELARWLSEDGAEVALVIASLWLPDGTGTDVLGQAHACLPGAKRMLLTSIGDATATEPLHRALALGQADLFLEKPWRSPEEWVYPQVGEALGSWWRDHRPRFELVRVVGPQWSARSHELRSLLARNAISFGFYPADSPEGRQFLERHAPEADGRPVVILFDGQTLVDPSTAQIVEALGGKAHPERTRCDVTIVGAGPAGLAAAVYGASEGLRVVVIEPEAAAGGQAGTSSMIRNYLGFPRGVSGQDLAARAYDQAVQFGAQFVHACFATGLRSAGRDRIVTLSDGSEVTSPTVVLATGVTYRRLGIPSLERLVGAGVFYGAAAVEAQAMGGEAVVVVGAGNSAGQAALHLAEYASKVTVLVRGDSLDRSMSAYLIDQLMATPNIEIRLRTRLVDGLGRHRLEGLVLADSVTGQAETVEAAALFVLIGGAPHTDWLDGILARDEGGYLLTCRDLAPRYESLGSEWPLPDRQPFPFETSVPGVFAIGDVRHNSVKRVASAVGAGAIGIFSVHEYLEDPMPELKIPQLARI
jgi:thioredoxin reductase (NADPH)